MDPKEATHNEEEKDIQGSTTEPVKEQEEPNKEGANNEEQETKNENVPNVEGGTEEGNTASTKEGESNTNEENNEKEGIDVNKDIIKQLCKYYDIPLEGVSSEIIINVIEDKKESLLKGSLLDNIKKSKEWKGEFGTLCQKIFGGEIIFEEWKKETIEKAVSSKTSIGVKKKDLKNMLMNVEGMDESYAINIVSAYNEEETENKIKELQIKEEETLKERIKESEEYFNNVFDGYMRGNERVKAEEKAEMLKFVTNSKTFEDGCSRLFQTAEGIDAFYQLIKAFENGEGAPDPTPQENPVKEKEKQVVNTKEDSNKEKEEENTTNSIQYTDKNGVIQTMEL